MQEEGFNLGQFVVRFKAHCRRFCNSSEAGQKNWERAACERMAELTGEPVSIIEAIHRGQHAPTDAVLSHMGWMKYDTFEVVTERRAVSRYLPERVHEAHTTNRLNNPLY